MRLDTVFKEYPNPFFIVKPIEKEGKSEDFYYEYVNEQFCRLVGKTKEELIHNNFRSLFPKGESKWFDAFLKTAKEKVSTYMQTSSLIIKKKITCQLFPVQKNLCACIIYDTTNLNNVFDSKEVVLFDKINKDTLTGVYNRTYLQEYKEKVLDKPNIGVSFFDINNLKEINDKYGHLQGDKYIVEFSNRLKSLYKSSAIFRFGGDEFIVITSNISEDEFVKISKKIEAELNKDKVAAMGYKHFKKFDSYESCINDCDKLMYLHKNHIKRLD